MFRFGFNFEDDSAAEQPSGNESQNMNDIPIVAHDPLPAPIQQSKEFIPTKDELFKQSEDIAKVASYSDVIAGVYEGGLKKWECSDDLMTFLDKVIVPEFNPNAATDDIDAASNQTTADTTTTTSSQPSELSGTPITPFALEHLSGSRVIDLGCGHGYPGLLCLRRGAGAVVFQDLNEDVLSTVTVPNALSVAGMQVIIRKDNPLAPKANASTEQQNGAVESRLAEVRRLAEENSRRRVAFNYDRSHYEAMKKMIVDGEEVDEQILEFVAMVEDEINEANREKGDVLNLLHDYGHGFIAHPHAQFFSGPWGQTLSDIMLKASPAAETATPDAEATSASASASTPAIATAGVKVTLLQAGEDAELNCFAKELQLDTPPHVASALAFSAYAALTENARAADPAPQTSFILIARENTDENSLDIEPIVAALTTATEAAAKSSLSRSLSSLKLEDETTPASATSSTSIVAAICVTVDAGAAIINWSMSRADPDGTSPYTATLLSALDAILASLASTKHVTVVGAWVSIGNYLTYLSAGYTELGWKLHNTTPVVRMGKQLSTEAPTTAVCTVKGMGTHPLASPFRFDTILSADTLYSEATMPIFITALRQILHRSGQALVAAKRYYFGVGGSTAAFRQLLETYGDMNCETVAVYQDGASNIREILCVKWK